MKIRIKRRTIIAKQYISAMSKTVGGIKAEIGGDKVWEVINNMAKILLMPKHTAHNHWRTELASKIYKVSKLKSTNHLPTAEQIYDWSYDEVRDSVSNPKWSAVYAENILVKYHCYEKQDLSGFAEVLDAACDDYFKWLADELSLYGIIKFDDIFNKLNQIEDEYIFYYDGKYAKY